MFPARFEKSVSHLFVAFLPFQKLLFAFAELGSALMIYSIALITQKLFYPLHLSLNSRILSDQLDPRVIHWPHLFLSYEFTMRADSEHHIIHLSRTAFMHSLIAQLQLPNIATTPFGSDSSFLNLTAVCDAFSFDTV